MMFDVAQIEVFTLMFVRVTAALAAMPIFGQQAMPNTAKIGLGFFLTLLLFGAAPHSLPTSSGTMIEIFFLAIKETACGLLIGFATQGIFYAVEFGGAILGYQTGFSIVSSIDPMTQNQNDVIARIQNIFVTLIFLSMNGHHLFLTGLAGSFQTIPLGMVHVNHSLMAWMVAVVASISKSAVMLAAPIMVALLLTDIGLGILARVAPQMNIFVVGFPLKVALVLLLMSGGMSTLAWLFAGHFAEFRNQFFVLLKLLSPL